MPKNQCNKSTNENSSRLIGWAFLLETPPFSDDVSPLHGLHRFGEHFYQN